MSKHDLMYEEMLKKKARVFPVHSSLLDTIKLEWENPERKQFFPAALKGGFRLMKMWPSLGTSTPSWMHLFPKFPKEYGPSI